jgi:uncharacterized protein YeaO (DUF488 family)
LDYFDLWLPELAPSAELLQWIRSRPMTPARWATFVRRYRKEMSKPPASRMIGLLAALSPQVDLAVGCFCSDEKHCHRSVLRDLLVQAGAAVIPTRRRA